MTPPEGQAFLRARPPPEVRLRGHGGSIRCRRGVFPVGPRTPRRTHGTAPRSQALPESSTGRGGPETPRLLRSRSSTTLSVESLRRDASHTGHFRPAANPTSFQTEPGANGLRERLHRGLQMLYLLPHDFQLFVVGDNRHSFQCTCRLPRFRPCGVFHQRRPSSLVSH